MLTLAACATPRTNNNLGVNKLLEEQRIGWLQQQQQWQFEGRFSIRIDDDKGSNGGTGKLSWKQSPGRLEMSFYGALGRGAWHLLANPEHAELALADGRVVRGDSVESIINSELGWDLPVADFSLWLRGMPGQDRTANIRSTDQLGRPESISYKSWQIKYLSWMPVGKYSLPKKIELTAPGRKLKLSVKNWNFQ